MMPANLALAPEPVWFFVILPEFCDLPPKTRFGGEIWGFHLHFREVGWIFVLSGKVGPWRAGDRKHQRNQ